MASAIVKAAATALADGVAADAYAAFGVRGADKEKERGREGERRREREGCDCGEYSYCI